MNIVVRNRKTFSGDGEWVCRGKSKLGNPFHLKDVEDDLERVKVIFNYRKWLWCRLRSGDSDVVKELDRLYDLAVNLDELNLICFCAPKPCHGDVIKSYLEWRHEMEIG